VIEWQQKVAAIAFSLFDLLDERSMGRCAVANGCCLEALCPTDHQKHHALMAMSPLILLTVQMATLWSNGNKKLLQLLFLCLICLMRGAWGVALWQMVVVWRRFPRLIIRNATL